MWEVQLCGDLTTLQWLSNFLKIGGTSVVKSESSTEFVLTSERFTPELYAAGVRHEAEALVRRIRGMVAFDRGEPRDIYCGAIYRAGDNGAREINVALRDDVMAIDTASVVGHIDALGNPRPVRDDSTSSDLEDWMALAGEDEHVAKAFRLMDGDWENWVGYYRLCEVMIDDRNGESSLANFAQIALSEIRRFKQSSNSVSVAGDASRHGREVGEPPANPMSLDDARQFIFRALRHWLQAKVGGQKST